jgi:tetratricopeptide (TPR) repeat protein
VNNLKRALSVASFALLVASGSVRGQLPTGRVAGRVTDSVGAPIAGASVVIRGAAVEVVTNESGDFLMVRVAPGTHTIAVRIVGFRRFEQEIDVVAGRLTTISVRLVREQALSLEPVTISAVARPVAVAAWSNQGAGDSARSAARIADSLERAGNWQDARRVLTSAGRRCPVADVGLECRLVISYATAYSFQIQARQTTASDSAAPLLDTAAQFYVRVLRESPRHAATIDNLTSVYRMLGRDSALENLLLTTMSLDSSRGGAYALRLGDEYRRQRAYDQSIAAYRRAIDADPDDPIARQRLVEAYRDLPLPQVRELFALVSQDRDWELRFPRAALDAYELAALRLGREDRTASLEACRRWMRLLSETQLLDSARLARMEGTWLTGAVRALAAFALDPGTPLDSSTAVWQGEEGTETFGRVALAIGRTVLSGGDAKTAEAYWQRGLHAARLAAPVSLDLERELAVLYTRHPELDPDGAKFRSMEAELFFEKSEAIFRADREAVQRYHTVLGLIYAERGRWGSPYDAHSALFQLDQALQTAHARDVSTRSFQPLPYLRALLAKGYEAIGARQQASSAYLDAAEASLDGDDIAGARDALTRAGHLSLTGSLASRKQGLVALASARARYATSDSTRSNMLPCDSAATVATRSAAAAGLPGAFLQRQSFKLTADCVLNGSSEQRSQGAARLLEARMRDSFMLVGVGDLLRLERINAEVLRRVSVRGSASHLDYRRHDVPGTGVPVSFAGETRPAYLTVSPELVLGARVLTALGSGADSVRIHIEGRSVAIGAGRTTAPDTTLVKRIRRVPGVVNVVVPPRPEQ